MTTNQMINRVRFYVDEKSEKNFSNDDIIVSLNVGQWQVQREIVKLDQGYFEKPAEINPSGTPPGVTPGIERYKLPDDFLQFKRVEDKNTRAPMRPIDLNEIATIANTLTDQLISGSGEWSYVISGQDIVFDPVPSYAREVRLTYVYRIPELVNGGAISEIPLEWHDLACVAAAIDCRIKDEAAQTDLVRKWNVGIQLLNESMNTRQTQEPKMVGGSKYY